MDAQQRLLKRNGLILWDAIKRADVGVITKKLTEESFPVNHPITDSHLSALAYACTRATDPALFEAILSRNPDVNQRASGGRSALHFASLSGNTVALQILLARPELDKNAQTAGLETPLMLAVKGGSIQAVAVLLNSGVNPFQQSGLGQTALHIAKSMKRQDLSTAIEQAVTQWQTQLAPDQIQQFHS